MGHTCIYEPCRCKVPFFSPSHPTAQTDHPPAPPSLLVALSSRCSLFPLLSLTCAMWEYTGSLWQKSTLAQLSPYSAHSSSSPPPPAPSSASSSSSSSGSGKTSIAASCLVNERVNNEHVNDEHVNGRGNERAAAAKHDWIWLLAQTSLRVAAQDDLVVSCGQEEGGVRERGRGDSHILIM